MCLLIWPWLDKYAGGEDNGCRFGNLFISSIDGVCPPLLIHPLMDPVADYQILNLVPVRHRVLGPNGAGWTQASVQFAQDSGVAGGMTVRS